MTFFDFLDHRYRTLNVTLQKDYSIPLEGELKAAYALIQYQRTLFKFLNMPVLVTKYILMNLGVMKKPSFELAPTPPQEASKGP